MQISQVTNCIHVFDHSPGVLHGRSARTFNAVQNGLVQRSRAALNLPLAICPATVRRANSIHVNCASTEDAPIVTREHVLSASPWRHIAPIWISFKGLGIKKNFMSKMQNLSDTGTVTVAASRLDHILRTRAQNIRWSNRICEIAANSFISHILPPVCNALHHSVTV